MFSPRSVVRFITHRNVRHCIVLAAAVAAAPLSSLNLCAQPAQHANGAHHAAHPPAEKTGAPLFNDLGAHRHPITTASKGAQRYFDQGLTLAYAFNHKEAERSFREAARLDPKAPMPWWGVALVLGPNINLPMSPENNPRAWEALQKARSLAATATDRERAYIDALSKRYSENPPQDRAPLDRAYADAMKHLARQYPDDLDAATLFAEALMDTMPWQYWMKDNRPKDETKEILAALEAVLAKQPDHVGACHLYIHAVEAVTPEKALAAADRLLDLVPGAGHLVHMPAHIYLRLGLYREATLANEAAAKADESYLAQCNAQGFYPAGYYPHNLHFLWYTNAMEGRSQASIDSARQIANHGHHMPLAEAQRFHPLLPMAMTRFGKWDEILQQPAPAGDQPYITAMYHYTRGLALNGKDQLDAAAKELDTLTRIDTDEKTKSLNTDTLPGATLITIAKHDLAGHLALEQGQSAKAIAELQQAVALEDELPYMEPPYCYMPMRHGLGAALLAAGKFTEAEAVYREDLRRNPHNGWSLFGLAQSLEAQGKAALAEEVMQRYHFAWIRADIQLTSSRF